MRPLDRVIGYKEIKKELYRMVDVLTNKEKYDAFGTSQVHGVIFEGEPGIGKTMLANAFIEECKRKSYVVRKDKPDGEFVNYLKDVFEKARENAPSIIFLDDMDKFANEDSYHRDAEEYVTIQSCIDMVKNEDVFVIATVNQIRDLPDSLRRHGRFDKIFNMEFPRGDDAKEIVSYYLKQKKVARDINVEEVVRLLRGRSCATLENVINTASILAGYEGKKEISQEELRKACLTLFFDTVEGECMDDDRRRKVAIHEAGHTVIAELRQKGSVDFVSVAIRTQDKLGITNIIPHKRDDFYSLESDVLISLAGKAASEIEYGDIDVGAHCDIGRAFDRTQHIIDNFTAYGFDSWCHGGETSNIVHDNLDIATKHELSRYYMQVKKTLIENRPFLHAIADGLMEKNTLYYSDIARIWEEIYKR